MKYEYELSKKHPLIMELCYNSQKKLVKRYIFSLIYIKDKLHEKTINNISSVRRIKSYYRVKKWIIENYPEMMI
jgi:hypothetical protein